MDEQVIEMEQYLGKIDKQILNRVSKSMELRKVYPNE